MGSNQRGSWGRWEVGTSTLKGWIDLRLGRRGAREGFNEEVDWIGCFPQRGVQDTSLIKRYYLGSAEPTIIVESMMGGLSDVRQHTRATR